MVSRDVEVASKDSSGFGAGFSLAFMMMVQPPVKNVIDVHLRNYKVLLYQ